MSSAPLGRPAWERQTARRLLGVSTEADPQEVERRFRHLARQQHPDLGGDPVAFRQLLEARAALGRSATRPGSGRPPLVVVHRGPWWRRLPRALVRAIAARVNPPPSRVQ